MTKFENINIKLFNFEYSIPTYSDGIVSYEVHIKTDNQLNSIKMLLYNFKQRSLLHIYSDVMNL